MFALPRKISLPAGIVPVGRTVAPGSLQKNPKPVKPEKNDGSTDVNDLDFGYCRSVAGKGNKDRLTILSSSVDDRLKIPLEEGRTSRENDGKGGAGNWNKGTIS